MSKQWEKLQQKTDLNCSQIWDNHTTPPIICRSKTFFCWLFFQLSSQYICCAIAVLHSQDKTSYVSKQDYSLPKRTCKKGALSASHCVKLFLPAPGLCGIILIPKVTKNCSRQTSEILYSKTLRSPLNWALWSSFEKWESQSQCICFQDAFVF